MPLRRSAARAAVTLAATLALLSGCGSSDTPAAYVALGDSYSSGVGADRYSKGACLRSPQSYVHRLGRRVSSFRACGGATAGVVRALQLKKRFPRNTQLVTITIGGNDAGFPAVLATCLLHSSATCIARIERAERYVRRELPRRLRRVYEAIRRRAPDATVVVAGYPRLLARGPWCGRYGKIDDREQRRLDDGGDVLAATIAAEVRRHRGFRFADVREEFAGHGACSRAPWIHALASPGINSFHPNVLGYAAYGRVVERIIRAAT